MPRIDHPASPMVPKLEGIHLFHFDGAPCAQRVRFALAEKGLQRGREVPFAAADTEACRGEDGAWVSRIVSLVRKDHLSPTYAQIQPNLVIPALVHDGVLYTESMDIVRYVDAAFGGEPLVPVKDPARMAEADALVDLGKRLHRSIRFVTFHWGLGRLGKLGAKEEAQLADLLATGGDGEQLLDFYRGYDRDAIPEAVYVEHLHALGAAFASLEERLQDRRAFLTGDTLTIADVIFAMKVLRLQECGYPFAEQFPGLQAWFERISSRPAFVAGVMGRHRAMNLAFRTKARVETMLGIGLVNAVRTHGVAA